MLNTTVGTIASPNTGENGGGIFDTGSHVTEIIASTFSGNTATAGAAIAGRSTITFNINNSTISGNVASDVGGGITTNGTVNLKSSTVVNNIAATDAPGGGAGLNSFGSGTYNMTNTLLAGNIIQGSTVRAANCGCSGGSGGCQGNKMISFGNNLEDADTCVLTETSDFVNTDPVIGPLQNNGGPTLTHSLLTGSPAIDTGSNVNCSVDQRGVYRPLDGNGDKIATCDIGAVELVAWVTLVTPNGGESIPSGSSYSIQWWGPSNVVAYSLQYSLDNGLTWKPITENLPVNSYAWTVPVPAKNKTQCLIRAIGYDALNFEVGQDTSDSPFAIEVLRLDSPNGGEALQSGTQHPITWTTHATKNPVAKVKLYYTKNNGTTWILITKITSNPGRYVWTIPSVKKAKHACRVKLELKDSTGKIVGADMSDQTFIMYP
jgi:hypothetical protein